jgi:hypothetical protein
VISNPSDPASGGLSRIQMVYGPIVSVVTIFHSDNSIVWRCERVVTCEHRTRACKAQKRTGGNMAVSMISLKHGEPCLITGGHVFWFHL